MFFQVNFSPVQKTKPKKRIPEKEPEEVPVLSLAPFTANPKIVFDDVKFKTTATRSLIIKNPTPKDIQLYVSRVPPDERNFAMSWNEKHVPSQSEVILDMQWMADVEGGWCDTISFSDGSRLKKDVGIIFKCIKPKKPKTKASRPATKVISTKAKSPLKRRPSPIKKVRSRSPEKLTVLQSRTQRLPLPNVTNLPQVKINSPQRRGTYTVYDKENFNLGNLNYKNEVFSSPKSFNLQNYNNELFTSPKTSFSIQRQYDQRETFPSTYVDNINKHQYSKARSPDEKFNDSLEVPSSDLNLHSPSLQNITSVNTYKTATNCVRFEERLTNIIITPIHNPTPVGHFVSGYNSSTIGRNDISKDLFLSESYLNSDTCYKNNCSTETYINGNLSTETYIKGNRSSETYTKDNLSMDTFVKENVSSSTYVKDDSFNNEMLSPSKSNVKFGQDSSPLFNSRSCPTLPLHENVYNCNSTDAIRKPTEIKSKLEFIAEESFVHMSGEESERETSIFQRKRKSDTQFKMSPPKKKVVEKSWSSKSFKPLKPLNLLQFAKKSQKVRPASVTPEKSVRLHDPDGFLAEVSNPFLLMATNAIDPFMSATLYYDPKWVDEQEKGFKKWLNALLTPPAELNSNIDVHPVDVAKLWQDCKRRDVSNAPSKESVSSKYHVNARLDSLRRASINLYRSTEMRQVLSKVNMMVENQKLVIRVDKDVHLDLGLQAEIMSLFLSYNPLWLRIGLETIYGVTVPLHSNSDIMGISTFILEHFFKDSYLLKKHKTVHSLKYAVDIKKLILKKFLNLTYFLDQAKVRKLIGHDPCLFCKNAPVKESRDILLKFSREVLSAVGDVTKYLKCTGYNLIHKQIYIHEFDFAVTNLGGDLRDGVRLTKVMEIILLVDDLITCLRVPAISRLQKIHNMKIAFDALHNAGFEILYDITPKDIVEGHKEKTLSFLWQIIYKFQVPRITKATTTIQRWWHSLSIVVKRRALLRERERRQGAAKRIAAWYHRKKLVMKLEYFAQLLRTYLRFSRASVKIQSYLRMRLCRKKFLEIRKTTLVIQTLARRWLVMKKVELTITSIIKIQTFVRMHQAKSKYLKIKAAVHQIQEFYIAKKLMVAQRGYYQEIRSATLLIQTKFRAKRQMELARNNYLKLKHSALVIQQRFRACQLMKTNQEQFLKLKNSALIIQSAFRACKVMQIQRQYYLNLQKSVLLIQCKYRAKIAMQTDLSNYSNLKHAVIVIQRAYRARKLMQIERKDYVELRNATVTLQRYFKANQLAKTDRYNYLKLRNVVINMQRRYRAKRAMLIQRTEYMKIKEAALTIQCQYRSIAAMKVEKRKYDDIKKVVRYVQDHFRANRSMKLQQAKYLTLRNAAIIIQQRFRANIAMQKEKRYYTSLKRAVSFVSSRYRANVAMKIEKEKFINLKHSTIKIQHKFRATRLMHVQRNDYQKLRSVVTLIQRRFQANKLAKKQHADFCKLKNATLVIQRHYRAKILMQVERPRYIKLKQATFIIQNHFRSYISMKVQKNNYDSLRRAAIIIQNRFRAYKLQQVARNDYLKMKRAVTLIQSRFRANRLMNIQKCSYKKLKAAASFIQRRYRANKLTKIQSVYYQTLRNSVILVQMRYRANKQMKIERKHYTDVKNAVTTIQSRFRANKLMAIERNNYVHLKYAVSFIQRQFRANRSRKIQHSKYQAIRTACVKVQHWYRATKLMQLEYNYYNECRNAAVIIQTHYRAHTQMLIEHTKYQNLRKTVTFVQAHYRATKMMKLQRESYLCLRKSVIIIQRKFRAHKSMVMARTQYVKLKGSTVFIQRRFRANRAMKVQRDNYQTLYKAASLIQIRYRSYLVMQTQYNNYQRLKKASVTIQSMFRANKIAKQERDNYIKLKSAALYIQRRRRAMNIMRVQRQYYEDLRRASIIVQRRYRAKLAMKTLRDNYMALRDATITVQLKFKANRSMCKDRSNYQKLRASAIILQKYFRSYLKVKREKAVYEARKKAAVKIQACFRGYLMRKIYKEEYKPILIERKRVHDLEKGAATKIQATWRGYRTRSEESPEITEIRTRSLKANERADSQTTLGHRRDQAVQILISDNPTLLQIISALEDLDYITRRCKDTCIKMSQILPEELYKMMRSASRSLPEMKACIVTTSILINFCKYSATTANCWCPEFMDSVFHVMMHWCDKESPLFLYLCTLIWLFAHNDDYKKVITAIPNFNRRVMKIKQLCMRKQSMVYHGEIRAFTVFMTYTTLPLPNRDPDWGLEYKHKPRTFTNSVHALNSILSILNVR